jgi:hypothetical protein
MAGFSEGGMHLGKRVKLCAACCFLACSFLSFCGILSAQAAPQLPGSAVLGQIIGDDISVIGPSSSVNEGGAQAIAFSNGSVIVVHSGKARVDFSGGGALDVCGPAKFTILSSGEALTVALSFGRVHLRFDATRPITIYTPMILATPVSISEQPRNATVGLTTAGAMCVLATHGAVRLQNQLSGESVIVPEPSEVLLQGASFENLPAAAGQCRCDFDESVAKNANSSPPLSASSASNATRPNQISPLSTQDLQVPRQVTQATVAPSLPVPRQTQSASPQKSAKSELAPIAIRPQRIVPPSAETATSQPVLKITLPSIGYDVKSGIQATEPLSVATLMLAKETVVQPQWIFHGTVIAPAQRDHSALVGATSAESPARAAKSQKETFWAKLRNFFFGRRAPCEGVGCS